MNLVVIVETLRRHLTSVAFIVFVILNALIAAASAKFGGTTAAWQALIGLLTLILGSQLVAPEFSSGTLQLILAKPVNRCAYLLSRVIGVTLAIWTALAICTIVDVTVRLLSHPGADRTALWAGPLNRALAALLACSLLALIGSVTRSYLHVAIYLVAEIGLSVTIGLVTMFTQAHGSFGGLGIFFEDHPAVLKGLHQADWNLFPDPPMGSVDRTWILMVLSNAAIALLAACLLFRNREVPYGAD